MKTFSDNEYTKLFRKFVHWEWYKDSPAKSVFLHCFLTANFSPGNWRGIDYERGELITSLPSLADETGLSIQQVRTALKKLKLTGELTERQQGRSRIITVVNYDKYQGSNRISNRIATAYQQDSNSLSTADKEDKKIRSKEVKNKEYIYMSENLDEKEADPKTIPSEENFEIIYKSYPKKVGKAKGYALYKGWHKGRRVNDKTIKLTNAQIYKAVQKYVETKENQCEELKYYKNFDTLMGNSLLDYVEGYNDDC